MHILTRRPAFPTSFIRGNALFYTVISRVFSRTVLALTLALATAASPAVAADYVDAIHYPSNEQGWDVFFDLEARLAGDFNDVCGDTFCEGEYSNLQALRYRCSVRQADSMMGQCVWIFAGGNAEINEATGKVVVDARTWACRTPLAPNTPLASFYSALSGNNPIDAQLPGTSTTIYQGLTDCLH
ncbi:hypothetical protein CAter10_2045 [Collimonas arenae]|nr:hypothetical protein CAter10_2045 [Collimonas arenae]